MVGETLPLKACEGGQEFGVGVPRQNRCAVRSIWSSVDGPDRRTLQWPSRRASTAAWARFHNGERSSSSSSIFLHSKLC